MRVPHLFAALALACLLSSCATRPPRSEAGAAATPATEHPKQGKPETRLAAIPVALKPNVEEPAAQPPDQLPVEPTRAEKIIRLVQNGGLIQADRNTLVFSKFRTAPNSRTGLFEDAVILGRLRRELKGVRGLPETVYDTATIRDARAYLMLDDSIPVDPAAGAIDAALKTGGVAAVHARIFSPIRL